MIEFVLVLIAILQIVMMVHFKKKGLLTRRLSRRVPSRPAWLWRTN